jgi:hypothetical protein
LTCFGVRDGRCGTPLLVGMLDLPLAPAVGQLVLVPPGALSLSFRSDIDFDLALNGIALMLTNTAGWPTSTENLLPGDVWANGNFVNVVPGFITPANAPAMFFGAITARQLLGFGAAILPTVDPLRKNQIWLNGVQVCVSAGS